MQDSRNALTKALGRTDIIAIGFGTIVGWSWVMMAASWISGAGFLGAIFAFLIGGAAILLVGFTYGELTSALPLAGGEFVFAFRAFGEKTSFVAGWIMCLAYVGVAAWEGIALATALDYIFPIPKEIFLWEVSGYQVHLTWSAVGMAGALLVTILNLISHRPAVLFQVMATAAIFIVVLVLFFGGITLGDAENIDMLFTDKSGFAYVLFMIPAMLIGFDVIPQSAEEMNIERNDIGRMIIVCIVLGIIWYVILIIGIGFAAPVEIRTSGVVPVADIGAYLFNDNIFGYVVIIGGILGIMTTWNGFFIGATRLIYAMGRARVLPQAFAKLNNKRMPYVAVIFVGIICTCAPLLGKNALVWLVDSSSVCTLIAYAIVTLSFIKLRKDEPDLERPFRVWGGNAFALFIAFVICAYGVLYIASIFFGSTFSPELYIIVIWLALGIIFNLIASVYRGRLSRREMEYLVFGKRFARRRIDHEQ